MIAVALPLPGDSMIRELARAMASADGRLLIVGGWVRDALAGRETKDIDLEVYGLSTEQVTELVRAFGFSGPVGRHFPVWRNTRFGIDLALPRDGNEAFAPDSPSALEEAVGRAARHRDLTVNAVAWDPLDESLFDPFGGRADLEEGVLRAVDAATFGSDPLRVLRAVRLAGRWGGQLHPSLEALCRDLDMSMLPAERIAEELRRVLIEVERPSVVMNLLAGLGQLCVWPAIDALRGVPQDPRWHPEGDVFVHNNMVLDEAAKLARPLPSEKAETLLWAALCHDVGKPATTERDGDRIRSHGHEGVGARITREWLSELRLAGRLVAQVSALVAHHLAPAQFISQGAGAKAYRRLGRKLDAVGLTLVDLERLARADHLGRTTPDAMKGVFEAGVAFLQNAEKASVKEGVRRDVVSSSMVMRRGIEAGPRLGRVLARCREVQDETGWEDGDRILERALGRERARRHGKRAGLGGGEAPNE